MKIAEISIKRPSIVIVVFTALTLLGIMSYFSLNYELLPKFNTGVVSVTTIYPGASPSEVENTVTKKIEDAVSSMENIKKLTATSFESLSMVVIELNVGTDEDLALNDAQRKVNAILSELPDDVEAPSLAKFSLDDLPILTLSATADMDGAEFYDLMDKQIQPFLSRVSGVAQVNIIGGQEREIQVNMNAAQLEAYNLSPLMVQQAILASNLDFPTGSVKTQNQDVLVRLSGKYASVEELRDLIVASGANGAPVRVRDIADVQDTQKDVEKIARVNQQSALILQVMKQSDANAVEVSRLVREYAERAVGENADTNLQIDIANDTSTYTLDSANAVIFDLFLAIVLVAVVMLMFLHSLRNAVIVMVVVPLSLIATFIGISMFGYTLNLMSLLGLSLVVGIVVDDAIVVIENIYRHMEMGKNKVRAAYDGAKEIGFTVVSITMVIVVVFVPIAISTGLVSDILRQFSVVVAMATLFSLLASFTIIPWLTSRFGKLDRVKGDNIFGRFILWFEAQLHRFTEWITSLLKWALDHKFVTLLVVGTLFVSSFVLVGAGYVGTEFFAEGDRGEFMVQIEMPKDASIEQTNQITMRAEKVLGNKPEVINMITTVGQSSDGFAAQLAPAYKSEITVKLVDRQEREDDVKVYAAKLKRELEQELVGAKVKTVTIGATGSGQQAPIEMVVMGTDLDSVLAFADEALALLREIPGTTETRLSVESGNPEITVQVDRDKMAALGLGLQTVGVTMQTAFNGNTDGKFRAGAYEYDINVRYDDFNRQNVDDVRNLLFVNDRGELIRLSQFATVGEGSGPSQLERRDKSTSVRVQSQTIGRPASAIVADWETKVEEVDRAPGVSYVWGGDMEMQSEGFGTLGIALLASILLVYFIMVALYDSFVYPFVVMFSIPLSVIGAFLALGLTNNTLNIFTILGLIMLIGLVAKNAIILVDFTNHLKEEGKSTREALILANKARLRPILMTTIAMVFGMLPIAIATGPSAEWKNGLAWVIIGGLLSSLFLTLIVVPVMYQIMDSMLRRLGMDKKGTPIEELMVEDYEHIEIKEYEKQHY